MKENGIAPAVNFSPGIDYRWKIIPLPSSDNHLRMTAWLILGLLFMRIPFYYGMLPVVAVFRGLQGFGAGIYFAATSVLTAYLIWHERDNLRDYHCDSWVVWMFLLGKPLEFFFVIQGFGANAATKVPFYAVYIIVSVGLYLALRSRAVRLPKPGRGIFTWILVAIALGILFGISDGFAIHLQSRDYVVAKILTLGSAISLVLLQAARAGLSEEPLFRGFLWEYLKKLGWTEGKILFFQAGLFAVAHVELLLLAMVIPFLFTLIAGLMLGWLAMRSRSISTSVMAHGFANGVGQMVSDYRIFEVLHLYR